MEQWPKDEIKVMNDESLEPNQLRIESSSLRSRADFHRKCLLGSFSYYPHKFPNCKELQAWANKKWKIPAGVVVKELNDEYFLFEFPLRVEARENQNGKMEV